MLKITKKSTGNRDYIDYGFPALDERTEKPWQRVNTVVPSPYILLVLGFYLLLGYLTQLVEDEMPSVVKDADVPVTSYDMFSEEAAMVYLHRIMGDQPRVAGTKYHLEKTEDLKQLLDEVAAEAVLPVTTDWQLATGDYRLNFSEPHVNSYRNVSNIIALLEGESGMVGDTLGSSLLLNCHYDSVPFAPGASDNVVFCAVMVECLKRMSKRPQKFKHNIIFLFNGAEENPLQGSHAFLQHPWSKGVITVVNLDSAGMNGKANLFQANDPRALKAYRDTTKRPSAQSFGEFLFSSGIVPSDTDFRIWRDFGEFYGVDIAFVKWGNVYHTRNDRAGLLRAGVVQCAGDMLLALTEALADTTELHEKATPETAVYYDYLNSFMVSYPVWVSHIVDALIFALAGCSVTFYVWIVGMRWSTVRGLLWAVLGRLSSMAAGILVATILIAIMNVSIVQMRYLSRQWIVVPIYWMPFIIGAVIASQAYDAWRTKKSGLNRSFRALESFAATRSLLALALFILLCVPRLATIRYLLAVPLFIMSIASVISLLVVRYLRVKAWQHLLLELLLSVPTTMFFYSICLRMDALMLPTLGRTATDSPDTTAAVLNVALAVLTACSVSGIELLFSRRRLWAPAVLAAATCLIIMFIPLSPYDAEGTAVQRHQWFHAEMISYKNNTVTSGVQMAYQDKYSVANIVQALKDNNANYSIKTDFTEECANYVYCNLPLYRTKFAASFARGMFLYMSPPTAFTTRPTLTLVGRTCTGDNCTLSFSMEGPSHNTITIWPHAGIELLAWSFQSPVIQSSRLLDRPVYSIVEATPTYIDPFPPVYFWLTFNVPTSQQSQPIVDITHHAHKKNHPDEFTPEYAALLASMPKWFNVDSSISIRSDYEF